jgi:nicotinamide-nucleotide amidase
LNRRARAATLAVGTEITDGQIVDRNSAWISKKLTDAGVDVVEHRAVADDRAEIERALRELSERVDVLFVTGGLGPTSDDFTREILAKFCGRELEFDDGSWKHIEQRFATRGLPAKPIQRQQCFYPKGSRVLKNNAGTANAFSFDHTEGARGVRVYAMPGPPVEIATVWDEQRDRKTHASRPS